MRNVLSSQAAPEIAHIIDGLEAHTHHFSLDEWAAFLHRLAPEDYAPRPEAAEPTLALPGTPGKIEVMRQRALRGEAIFRRGDMEGSAPVADRVGVAVRRGHNGRVRQLGVVEARTG